uniref:Uncharacterized protein n=1 Tax=Anguilla anguilla TaxID=7936 RepID=A0A0E9SLZ9_ANGAN
MDKKSEALFIMGLKSHSTIIKINEQKHSFQIFCDQNQTIPV